MSGFFGEKFLFFGEFWEWGRCLVFPTFLSIDGI
jgi:hypothetical protein